MQAGARSPDHQNMSLVLGYFANGPFGPILENNTVNWILRELYRGGVGEIAEILIQSCGIIQQFLNPAVVIFFVIIRHCYNR